MKKRYLLVLTAVFALLLPLHAAKKVKQQTQSDREYWCSLAYKMAQPVLENMAKGELQKNMKTEFSPSFDNRDRSVVYMETFGRLMAGIVPWLTLPDDGTPGIARLPLLGQGWTEPRGCRLHRRVVPPWLGHLLGTPR